MLLHIPKRKLASGYNNHHIYILSIGTLPFYGQTIYTKKTMFKGYHDPWLYHCLYCTYVNDTNWVQREEVQSSYSLSLCLFS
jgi:hypothetical protein